MPGPDDARLYFGVCRCLQIQLAAERRGPLMHSDCRMTRRDGRRDERPSYGDPVLTIDM